MGLGGINPVRIILGATFDIRDIACYFAGCAMIWLFERLRVKDNEHTDIREK